MNISELRQSAKKIWEAALNAANPATCIRNFVRVTGGLVSVAGKEMPIRGRLIVIGAGKAAARMAQVIEELLGKHITAGLVVTKYGHGLPLQRVQLVEAGHPIPDAAGVRGVQQTRELLKELSADDIVLCLISGGGSALWPAPAEGVTLEEKQEVTSLLLRAGADIREINAVRKHLSSLKGGQLAKWAAPARVISFIMSDVIGDPLDFIASGPTAPDTTSFSDALGVVQKYGLRLPMAVIDRFQQGARGGTPKPGDPVFKNVDNHIIANNQLLIEAARAKARELKLNTLILGTEIEGEAKDAGRFFAALAREIDRSGNPLKPPACILAAGETTVTVHGNGLGGRNQEMALAWAIALASRAPNRPACFASVATDGTDGPTTAAGGLVDAATCSRGVELGLAPANYLQRNDSFHFLDATGDLIVTGPTQTNLMDLQILLVA
ncbi:MAG: glycerate kinase [Acidobacteria bacterium]|nr:MAG: glycerate kinase [Acidobacteriota bacterium]